MCLLSRVTHLKENQLKAININANNLCYMKIIKTSLKREIYFICYKVTENQ